MKRRIAFVVRNIWVSAAVGEQTCHRRASIGGRNVQDGWTVGQRGIGVGARVEKRQGGLAVILGGGKNQRRETAIRSSTHIRAVSDESLDDFRMALSSGPH